MASSPLLIPELLEIILSKLSPLQIIAVQSVCHLWHDLIATSSHLRQLAWLDHVQAPKHIHYLNTSMFGLAPGPVIPYTDEKYEGAAMEKVRKCFTNMGLNPLLSALLATYAPRAVDQYEFPAAPDNNQSNCVYVYFKIDMPHTRIIPRVDDGDMRWTLFGDDPRRIRPSEKPPTKWKYHVNCHLSSSMVQDLHGWYMRNKHAEHIWGKMEISRPGARELRLSAETAYHPIVLKRSVKGLQVYGGCVTMREVMRSVHEIYQESRPSSGLLGEPLPV